MTCPANVKLKVCFCCLSYFAYMSNKGFGEPEPALLDIARSTKIPFAY